MYTVYIYYTKSYYGIISSGYVKLTVLSIIFKCIVPFICILIIGLSFAAMQEKFTTSV